jgi:hypothetical protein
MNLKKHFSFWVESPILGLQATAQSKGAAAMNDKMKQVYDRLRANGASHDQAMRIIQRSLQEMVSDCEYDHGG